MDELAHNAWATPHDIALQQLEYSRRQEAMAREANNRYGQYQNRANPGVDGLTTGIGNLGYGQTNQGPAAIQARQSTSAGYTKQSKPSQRKGL